MTEQTTLAKPETGDVSMDLFNDLFSKAERLLKSGILPPHLKTPEQIVTVVLIGRELGVPMMQAIRKIFPLPTVREGRIIGYQPTLAVELQNALVQRTGELEERKIEDDGATCIVTVKRRGLAPHVSRFSMQDAERMGLANKDNWRKQPGVMRQWRALAANYRVTFADAIGGMYSPEEIGPDLGVDERGHPVDGQVIEARAEAIEAGLAESMMPRRKTTAAESDAAGRSAQEERNTTLGGTTAEAAVRESPVAKAQPIVLEPFGSCPRCVALQGFDATDRCDEHGGPPPGPRTNTTGQLDLGTAPPEVTNPRVEDPRQPVDGISIEPQSESARMSETPLAKPVEFQIGGQHFKTAGITRAQMLETFELVPRVNRKHGKGQSEALLENEFKVSHRRELTEDAAWKYIARLRELAEA